MIYNQWILIWLKNAQSETRGQNIFKRKKTVAVSRREDATIAMSKNITQMNIESQRNHNKLLEWKKD